MKTFIVQYDLMAPGRDYKNLQSALQVLGARRTLLSTWSVQYSGTATQLCAWLRPFVDPNDRLLVTLVADWSGYQLMARPTA